MRKHFMLCLAFLMSMLGVKADNVSANDVTLAAGETSTMAISLTNEKTDYVSFQMDLTLPEGVTIDKAGSSLTNRVTDKSQELNIGKQSENVYRLTSASFALTPISGNSGELITLALSASDTSSGGQALLTNSRFVTSNSERVIMEETSFDINVSKQSPNDENVIAEKDWTLPNCFMDYEEIGASCELTADGLVINNPQVQDCPWTPQTFVLDGATLQEGHSYKVIIDAKIPSDGQLRLDMGNWAEEHVGAELEFSVTGSEEFQEIEAIFEGFPGDAEGVHVLFQNGGIAGTCVVRNVKIIDLTDNENIVAEQEWTFSSWFEDGAEVGATCNLTTDGVAIYNPLVNEVAFWQPQTMVLPDGATLEENHSYKVVVNAKIPSDGQLQINMGSWGFNQQYAFPVTASDDFQDIETIFYDFPSSEEDVHVLFQNGGIEGTCVVRNVKIIDLGDIRVDLTYDYNTENKTATVIKNPNGYYRGTIVIPTTVTYEGEKYTVNAIADNAFSDCPLLNSITIPAGVESIGEEAFSGCDALAEVFVGRAEPVSIAENTFTNRSNATLHVSAGCKSAYEEAAYWQEFNGIVSMVNIVANSDLEGTDRSCFFVQLYGDQANGTGIIPATIIDGAGKDFSRGIVVQSEDNQPTWWSTQFFIRMKQEVPVGTRYHLRFDLKASRDVTVNTEHHWEPGVIFNGYSDNVDFTTSWQHYEYMGEIGGGSEYQPMRTVAINLSGNGEATTYYLDNIVFEIEESQTLINFADDNVKALCVANWDTDENGELSKMEADAVTSLGEVFKGNTDITSFEELRFFTGLTEIDNNAFEGCENLASVSFPSRVEKIGENAFNGTGLTSLVIPDRIIEVGPQAFYGNTKLESVHIGTGLSTIGWKAFGTCPTLTEIVVAEENSNYNSPEGSNCVIEKETNTLVLGCLGSKIPSTVTAISELAFEGSWNLGQITLPSGLVTIGDGAFSWCGLSSMSIITIPESVERIENRAFGNTGVRSVSLPANLQYLGEGAFEGCDALTEVHVGNSEPVEIAENTFTNRTNATLYVPSGSVAAYREAAYWQEFKDIVPMVNIITNSDLEDSDNTSFSYDIQDGVGVDGSRGIEIQSEDNPTNPWDTQLFISLPYGLPAGTKYHLSFDYKASQDATGTMLFQEGFGENIGDITNVDFTTDWHHFDLCGTYDSESIGEDIGERLTNYICFHLSQIETATTYHLDNIVFEIKPFAYATEAPQGRGLKNNGEVQELVVGGSAINGTLMYSLDGENYSEEIPTASKSGWYVIYYKVVSDSPEIDDSEPASVGSSIDSRWWELNSLIQLAQIIGVNTDEAETANNDDATYDQVEDALASLRPECIAKLGEGIDSDLLPLNVTSVIDLPNFDDETSGGWIWDENEEPDKAYGEAHYFDRTFNLRQTISGLPNGTYKLKAKGFHRPGNQNDVYADYMQGTNNAKAQLYANEESVTLKNIAAEARDSKVDDWSGIDVTYNEQTQFIPLTVEDAHTWFEAGYYENELIVTVTDGTLTFGVRLDESVEEDWVDFTNFRLEYMTNYVYIDNTEVLSGTDNTLSIKMKNNIPMEGFEFDLYLPDGITVAVDNDGFPEVYLSSERTNERKTNSFDAAFQEDGSIRVLAASTNGSTISGTDGEIVTVKVNVDGNLPEGDYTLLLKNISLSEGSNAVSHRTEQVKGKLTIVNGLLGDANRDTYVDVADFTATAHYILGNTPESFNAKAANANEDDIIDVGDLTAIAHLILYGSVVIPDNSSPAKPWLARSVQDEGQNPENYVYINPVSIKPGNEITLSVNMKNVVEAEGFEFDLYLPEGMTFATDEDGFVEARLSTERTTAKKTNSFDAVIQQDGSLRILAASTNGSTISGNDGEVALITINVDPSIAAGEYQIMLKNIAISDINAVSHRTELLESIITILNNGISTGIDGISDLDENADWYTIDGRKLSGKPNAKGVYIMNGKKVSIK